MIWSMGRVGAVVALGAASMLGGVGAAAADPGRAPNSIEVSLVCDGVTYEAVVNGNGDFQVAHDTDSNTILVPTAFGPFHGVVTDDAGGVIDDFTDPPLVKGNSTKSRITSLSCTFSVDDTFTVPELGVLHFHGEGSVVGFSTPA